MGQITFPFVGFKSPHRIFKIVVLPHPDFPSRVIKSDLLITRFKSLITISPLLKTLPTSLSSAKI